MLMYKVVLHKKRIDVEIGGKRDTFLEMEEKRETSWKRGKKGKNGSGICTLKKGSKFILPLILELGICSSKLIVLRFWIGSRFWLTLNIQLSNLLLSILMMGSIDIFGVSLIFLTSTSATLGHMAVTFCTGFVETGSSARSSWDSSISWISASASSWMLTSSH